MVETWSNVVVASLSNLWQNLIINFIPTLIGALFILIVGLIVASALGTIIEKIINSLQVDALLKRIGVEKYIKRGGLNLDSGRFLGQIVYWFLVLAFLLAASDILGFYALSSFINNVLLYIPNIAVAVLIMLVAVVIANFLRRVVRSSVLSARLHASQFLGAISWYSIIIIGFLTALDQLQIQLSFINTIVTGIIAMLAIAGGIAFGLGGKDYAGYLIEKFRDQVEER